MTVYNVPQTYYVVDCGASGHNIRARPNLKALPVGKLKLGCSFLVIEQVIYSSKSWILRGLRAISNLWQLIIGLN